MALVLADRVRETTTSSGTTAITLGGAYSGFQTFSAAIGNGNTTYYTIANVVTGDWEVGIGTYTSSGNTLSRDTVLASSNAGSLVNFAIGSKDVFVTQPAERAVYVVGNVLTATNNAVLGTANGGTNLSSFTSGGAVYATSTSALTTGTLPLTSGGTGATTVAGAQTNLQVDPAGTAVAMAIALG